MSTSTLLKSCGDKIPHHPHHRSCAEMLHCTIGDVRDKVHRTELTAMRWGQQFRFFRDEVIVTLLAGIDESGGLDVDPDQEDQS